MVTDHNQLLKRPIIMADMHVFVTIHNPYLKFFTGIRNFIVIPKDKPVTWNQVGISFGIKF